MIAGRAVALIFACFAAFAPLKSAGESVVDFIVELESDEFDEDSNNFSVLYSLISAADLNERLGCDDGLTKVTVLAPTDAAFELLAESLGYQSEAYDERDIFDYLATVLGQFGDENSVEFLDLIAGILSYHIITSDLLQDDIKGAGELETLLEELNIRPGTDIEGNVLLVDAASDLGRNPRLVPTNKDIATCNGYVQVIDRVLLPFSNLSSVLPGPVDLEGDGLLSVVDIFLALDETGDGGAPGYDNDPENFDVFLALLKLVNFDLALTCDSDGAKDFTIFAPTDQAFYDLSEALGYEGDYNETQVYQFLASGLYSYSDGDLIGIATRIVQYHVLPRPMSQSMIKSFGELDTLAMTTVEVTEDGTMRDLARSLPDPKLVDSPADWITCNGFLQIIDGVLLHVDDLLTEPQEIAAPSSSSSSSSTSVIDVITSLDEDEAGGASGFDSNWRNFDILFRLIEIVPPLSEQLSCGGLSDVTVLAPTDAAFGLLAYSVGYNGLWYEDKVFDFLADVLMAYANDDLVGIVEEILLYHVVVDGALTRAEIIDTGTLNTAQGETIDIGQFGTIVDKETAGWNARLVYDPMDIETCNGYMQVISRVLLPVDDLSAEMATSEIVR